MVKGGSKASEHLKYTQDLTTGGCVGLPLHASASLTLWHDG